PWQNLRPPGVSRHDMTDGRRRLVVSSARENVAEAASYASATTTISSSGPMTGRNSGIRGTTAERFGEYQAPGPDRGAVLLHPLPSASSVTAPNRSEPSRTGPPDRGATSASPRRNPAP